MSLIINYKVVYRFDLYLFYILIYLKHKRDALPKNLKKADCVSELYTIVKALLCGINFA
jgi:hypothetical protein